MTDREIDTLGTKAADIAANAAIDWLKGRGYEKNAIDIDRLSAALKKHVMPAVLVALDDARAAYAANMGRFAHASFALSMVNAGIAAAREAVAS